MKKIPHLLLALAGAVTSSLTAATYTFDTSADYSNNFTPGFTSNTGTGGTAPFWSSSTYPAHIVKFDSTGSGSASFSTLNAAVGSTSYTVKADVLFSPTATAFSTDTGALSFSFLTNIGTANGYAAIFRFTGSNTADFRIYEGVNASTGALGTLRDTKTLTSSGANWSTSSFYTLSLNVSTAGDNSGISFIGSILSTGGTPLGSFTTYTDTSPSSATNTSVGVRMGVGSTDVLRMDNFSVTTSLIPEPSTFALLGGFGALALAIHSRRKRI